MKRVIALILSLTMLLSLVACGGGGDVEITVPASFIGEDATQESLEESVSDTKGIKSVVLNEDGSATYKMSKAAHEEMLSGIAETIDTGLKEMVDGEDYSFTKIDHNADYTSFTVETEAEELGFADSFSTMAFYMYGGMYAAFSGKEVDNIHIDFVNATTKEVIKAADSKDMGKS